MLSHFFSFFDISVDVPFNPRLRFLPPLPKQFMSAEEALAPTLRHQHILPDGRVAYEWSQSLSDVTVFVPCPQGVRGRDLDVCIERERCRLGLKGNPPYLDVSAAFSSRMEQKETALYPALVSGKDQRGGTEERRRAGGAKRFFCFFSCFASSSTTRDRRSRQRQNRSRPFNLLSSPPLHTKIAARDLQRRQGFRVVLDAR